MKKYKKSDSSSYTLGITLTFELLNIQPHLVERVYYHPLFNRNETFEKLVELTNRYRIPFEENQKIFHVLSDKENCYVIGVFRKEVFPIDKKKNHLVLVNPSNAGNLGTIMRSMVGFGIENLICITPSVDPFDPKTIRASMGSFFHLNISLLDSFENYQLNYPDHHLYPFMLQASKTLQEVSFVKPFTLIFGNEATGLDPSFLSTGEAVIIPHTSKIDSLNLPIAVSIALYQSSSK